MPKTKDFQLKGRSVLICVPAYDGSVPVEFMMSYLETLRTCHQHGITVGMEVRMGCALIQKARNDLVHTALENEVTDIFFIDSDIQWAADDFLRLLAWSTDHDFVSGCYPVKQDEPKFHITPSSGENGYVIQNEYGLLKANAVPAGFMNLRPAVFHNIDIPTYKPHNGTHKGKDVGNYFDNMHKGDKFYGEDIAFCIRHRDAGGEIWVDPAVSVKHIGRKVYDHTYIDFIESRGTDNGSSEGNLDHAANA